MSESQPLLQVDEEQPADPVESSKGFAAGYHDWSTSFGAFETATFHGIIYIFLGILFYSFILDTKLSIVESIYFAVGIFTTVGYGDISPASSNAGMIFTIFYAMYGIIILGIFLGVLADFAARREHKIIKAVKKAATAKYLELIKSKAGKSPKETPEEEEEEEEDDDAYQFLHSHDKFAGDIYLAVKDQKYLLLALVVFAIPIMFIEKWSFIQGLYWLAITGTTVGLGDEKPDGEFAKLYATAYIPVAVALVGRFVANVASSYVDRQNDRGEEEFLNQALTESSLEKMDTDHDNKVSKVEFLFYMLKTMGKAEKEEMRKILEIFDELDKDGSGFLSREDLEFIPQQTAKIQKTGL